MASRLRALVDNYRLDFVLPHLYLGTRGYGVPRAATLPRVPSRT